MSAPTDGTAAGHPAGNTSTSGGGPGELRVFLIADVRGYTRYTAEHGDEAAARLAGRFAEIADEVVSRHDGSVLELRGDEALAVFGSARAALRAALALQDAFVSATVANPAEPLPVGIGLDVGEAVPLQRGYRGGALNLAARLCAQAGPGEVLASQEVTHLARAVDGLVYEPRGRVELKGLPRPVPVVLVRPRTSDPARQAAFDALVRPPTARVDRRQLALAAVLAGVLLVAAVTVVLRQGASGPLHAVANSVAVVAPGGPQLVRSIPVGTEPDQVAFGAGAAWAVNTANNTVDRIDPTLLAVVQAIPVGGEPRGLAVEGHTVWVANTADGTVSRVDATTNQVVQTVRVGNAPNAVAVTPGAVWVANRFDGTVTKLDPGSGAVLATVRVGEEPVALAADAQGVWVANFADDTVSRIDPTTDQVDAPINVGGGPAALTVTPGAVWVANQTDGTVSRIDRATGTVNGLSETGRGPSGVAVLGGTVWVANGLAGTLTGIDAATAQVRQTIQIGQSPRDVVPFGSRLWVSLRPDPAVAHRGGTLRISDSLDSIDPTLAYYPSSWQLLSSVYDGLVDLRRVAGVDGLSLVPDLADALPKPSDGGRVYTFHLRPGIRYSNGTLVRASDIRRGLERALLVGSQPNGGPFSYFEGIVGGSRCVYPHRTCDLSSGVVADDAAGTVTIRLTAPDPEFLYKLSLVNASAAAPGAPFHDVGTHPLPATGPYMVQSHRPGPGGQTVLVRNPYFRLWSADAQPDGYPDRIVFTAVGPNSSSAAAAEQGLSDLTSNVTASQVVDAQVRYPGQVETALSTFTVYMSLDVTRAPFDSLAARQAVNLAVDRQLALAASGGSVTGEVHCQVLPASFPGYQPYCPYTQNPGSGAWTGPDLARATRLVAASGTRGEPVEVWTATGAGPPDLYDLSRVFVQALQALGYQVRLHSLPANSYFSYLSNPQVHVQAAAYGWGPDFPTPNGFFGSILTCGAIALGFNGAHYCDHTVDALVAHDLALESTDPAAADAGWAALDRRITDAAPIVPLVAVRSAWLTSARVGNFTANPQAGVLYDQLWVQ